MKVVVYVVEPVDREAEASVTGSFLDAIQIAKDYWFDATPQNIAAARVKYGDPVPRPLVRQCHAEYQLRERPADKQGPVGLELRVISVGPPEPSIRGDHGRGWWGSSWITRHVVDAEPIINRRRRPGRIVLDGANA